MNSTSDCFLKIAVLILVWSAGMPASARPPKDAWTVTRSSDPITGASSCVVAAPDQIGKFKYSRVGYLYPVVENNSQHGLLVGVSSGGPYRVPTGDIVWRVGSNPFRTLRAIDNPIAEPVVAMAPVPATGNPDTDKRMADAMANAMKTAGAFTATSTLAGGEKAAELLREMLSGTSLLYRQAAAAQSYGLPSSQTYAVGQLTSEGLRPIPLDASFHRGLAECGISLPAASTAERP